MKKIINSSLLLAGIALLASCTYSAPYLATKNPIGSKRGIATDIYGLGHCDVGAGTAAKNAGIKRIATVDIQVKQGLAGNTFTTIVTGE